MLFEHSVCEIDDPLQSGVSHLAKVVVKVPLQRPGIWKSGDANLAVNVVRRGSMHDQHMHAKVAAWTGMATKRTHHCLGIHLRR